MLVYQRVCLGASFEARRLQDAVHAHHLRAAVRAGGRRWPGAHPCCGTYVGSGWEKKHHVFWGVEWLHGGKKTHSITFFMDLHGSSWFFLL